MNKEKIKNIFKAYYTPPWQQRTDYEEYLNTESEENIILFIKNMIKPQMNYFMNNESKDYDKRKIYVQNVNKEIKLLFKKKKKFKYSDWMNETLTPKKTDEEYKQEHREYLQRTLLVPSNNKKLDKI